MPPLPGPSRRRRAILCLLLSLPQAACGAGWRPIPVAAPSDLPPRQQVQVWRRGEALQLHGLRLTEDSVSGIPYLQPLTCDSCRIAIPRTEMDSLRTGNPGKGFWGTVGLGLLALLVVGLLTCWAGSRCDLSST